MALERKFTRFDTKIPVTLCSSSFDTFLPLPKVKGQGYMTSLGLEGAGIEIDQKFKLGSSVNLSFDGIEHLNISATAKVVWVGENGVGLKFVGMDENTYSFLHNLLLEFSPSKTLVEAEIFVNTVKNKYLD